MKYTLKQLNELVKRANKTGGSLYLGSLMSIPEGFNPTVGGSLYLGSLMSIPEGFNPTVGGSLYLGSLTSIPEGFNPTVGGWLDLSNLTSIPEGFNPTVGGDLYLGNLTSIPEGFNPTVGGNLYLRGLTSKCKKLKDGDYAPGNYLYCDGILTHVKREKKIGEYTYYIGKIKSRNVIFDGENYAHCESFEDGVCDLEFKKARDRGADQYKTYTPDTVVTFDEAKTMYRVITGACKAGTEQFVRAQKGIKDTYTVREIIDITKGAYRADVFKRFFENK